MEYSIRISEADWDKVHKSLFTADGNENAGVLLCGVATTSSEHILLTRKFIPVPIDQYIARENYHLEVSPEFYNQVISAALWENLSPVLIHSHPHHQDAWFSGSDDYGENRLLNVFNSLLPDSMPASLVITPVAIAGRRLEKGKFRPLTSIGIYGVKSRRINLSAIKVSKASDLSFDQYDRQVRIFGHSGQKLLKTLKLGIVGVGGIGSIVAEELARAGIRDFVIVDPDVIEASNVSRQFGATAKNVGQPKVKVTAENIKRLGADTVRIIQRSAINQTVLMEFRDRDIIFSCVDNDRTRAILNRFAHQYLVPVVDHGVRLDARGGQITAAAGRVTLVGSGMVCLRCSHHLNAERIRAESLPPEEQRALHREGYIMGIDEPAPAIVSLNTIIAGLGVTAVFNMFLNVTGGRQPVNQIYDAKSGTLFPVEALHEQACDICSETVGSKGLGDIRIVSAYNL